MRDYEKTINSLLAAQEQLLTDAKDSVADSEINAYDSDVDLFGFGLKELTRDQKAEEIARARPEYHNTKLSITFAINELEAAQSYR